MVLSEIRVRMGPTTAWGLQSGTGHPGRTGGPRGAGVMQAGEHEAVM